MARSPTSFYFAALALGFCANMAVAGQANQLNQAAELEVAHRPAFSRAEVAADRENIASALPIDPSVGANATGVAILNGVRALSAPWQVQIYSTYVYTQADVLEDDALPSGDPNKEYLSQQPAWERIHRCGGAYIGDMWVLTAAHCIPKMNTNAALSSRRIRVGTLDLTTGGTTFRIERIIVHKFFVGEGLNRLNDIALLKIEADTSTDAVEAAKLKAIRILGDKPGDIPLADFDNVTVSGWGRTDARLMGAPAVFSDGTLMHGSPTLMEVELARFPQSSCAAVPAYIGLMGASVICVGTQVPGRDACQGDSGGPLRRLVGANDNALVGLVSVGRGCGVPGMPAIYTNVVFFKSWISAAKLAPAGQVSRR